MSQPGAAELHPLNSAPQVGDVHVTAEQALARHDTSHAHDGPQVTPEHDPEPPQSSLQGPAPQAMVRHELPPVQSRSHRPAPHATSLQLWVPLHVIVHDLASVQTIPLRHALGVEHWMLQLQPGGQVTVWLQALGLSAQSTVQVIALPSHDVHPGGHDPPSPAGGPSLTLASIGRPTATQSPSAQVRPSRQSDVCSHEKSPLRWLIEQLPATTAVRPRTASQSAMSFTACLRW